MKWGKLWRRTLALFLAVLAVGGLTLTVDTPAGIRAQFTARASADASGELPGGMARLLIGQSPYLRAGYVLRGRSAPLEPTPADDTGENDPAEELLSAEEESPLPPSENTGQDVIARTFRGTAGGKYTSDQGIFVYNRTHQAVDFKALSAYPVQFADAGKGPQILIVHTHATEAYTQDETDVYEESDPYRTTDCARNMVRVGDEMAAVFAQAGLNVLHDRTLHDHPSYNASYPRCYETVRSYLETYPSISIVLDVHRDALVSSDGLVYKAIVENETDQPDIAQVMLVVGTNESGGDHPEWERNLAFAVTLERLLNEETPTLARPISLRSASYNQQLSPGFLLVEVGTHGNTLQEAIRGARAFAETASRLILRSIQEE